MDEWGVRQKLYWHMIKKKTQTTLFFTVYLSLYTLYHMLSMVALINEALKIAK